MAKTYEQAKRELLPDSGRWQDRYSSPAGYEEALRDLDRQYGKLPKYFSEAGSSGGTRSNISSAPDGTIFKMGTSGLEGYTPYFKKQGGQLVNISEQEAMAGEINEVNVAAKNSGIGIAPRNPLTAAEIAAGERGAVTVGGIQSVGQPSPITIGGGTLTPGTSLGAGGAVLGPGSSAVVNGQQVSVPGETQNNQPLANFQFSTGDPEYDKFLNEQFLPQFRAQFQDNPLAMYNAIQDPEFLKATVERVGRVYGPVFEGARKRVQEDFDLRQSEIDLRRREQEQQFAQQEQEVGTARTRLGEDVGKARQREARNYQTAVSESSAAFASAGRAFGGGREEKERRLGEESQTRLGDIAEQEKRRLEDLQRQQEGITAQRGFTGEQIGLAGTELATGRTRSLADIEAEKLRLGREELATIRELAGQTLGNPQFNPRSII